MDKVQTLPVPDSVRVLVIELETSVRTLRRREQRARVAEHPDFEGRLPKRSSASYALEADEAEAALEKLRAFVESIDRLQEAERHRHE